MPKTKQLIRRLLGIPPPFMQALFSLLIIYAEQLIQIIRCWRLSHMGMREFKVKKGFPEKRECHILASGWSLNISAPLIDKETAFVIGFNFSFLKYPNPDLHFIENASCSSSRFFINTIQHYAAIRKTCPFFRTRLIFKNVSEFKNSTKLIAWLYGNQAEYVRDRHYRIFSREGLRPTLQLMLKDESCIPQAVSSAVSLIFLARIMGFKRIVVHGLDFYGPHFYGKDLDKAIFETALVEPDLGEMPPHKTAVGESNVGTPDVLSEVRTLLAQEGIQLLAAVRRSPSSELLGSHYD